jgi:hypothetical protein
MQARGDQVFYDDLRSRFVSSTWMWRHCRQSIWGMTCVPISVTFAYESDSKYNIHQRETGP